MSEGIYNVVVWKRVEIDIEAVSEGQARAKVARGEWEPDDEHEPRRNVRIEAVRHVEL